ncbi:hypothetical protein VNO80_01261 [Phaseolus coccineus]|uniref:Uncharacterized protein n=1 Tax=Phaseolus coccineus TaxID=3886 RepID=A0AAN9WW81_PHACN
MLKTQNLRTFQELKGKFYTDLIKVTTDVVDNLNKTGGLHPDGTKEETKVVEPSTAADVQEEQLRCKMISLNVRFK